MKQDRSIMTLREVATEIGTTYRRIYSLVAEELGQPKIGGIYLVERSRLPKLRRLLKARAARRSKRGPAKVQVDR